MSSESRPDVQDVCELEDAIAACGGDARATVGALIIANSFLEFEIEELRKAVSHAFVRSRGPGERLRVHGGTCRLFDVLRP